jgi:hypothetical protein
MDERGGWEEVWYDADVLDRSPCYVSTTPTISRRRPVRSNDVAGRRGPIMHRAFDKVLAIRQSLMQRCPSRPLLTRVLCLF